MSNTSERPSEPPYAEQHLQSGAFGIGEFRGQHAIFIPLPMFEALGEDRITELANKIYGESCLKHFGVARLLYKNSYMIELPPDIVLMRRFVATIRNEAQAILAQQNPPA